MSDNRDKRPFCVANRSRPAFCCILALLAAGCGQPSSTQSDPRASAAEQSEKQPVVRSDWPRMSGPLSNHSSPETNLDWTWGEDGPVKLWSKPCGSGYSMPIVFEGKVLILGREDDRSTLAARSIKDGSEAWLWNGDVATYTDEFETYSDGPYSTPCIVEDRIFFITGDGVLVELLIETGDEQKKLNLLEAFNAPVGPFPWGTSPLAYATGNEDVRLVINVGGANESGMVCLDATDFSTVWQSTSEGRSYATPRLVTIDGRDCVIQLTQKSVVLIDADSGELIWSEKFGGRGDPTRRANSVSPLVVEGDPLSAFVTVGPGVGLLKINLPSLDKIESDLFGSEKNRTLDSQFNNLITDGQRIYGFTSKWNRQAQFRGIDVDSGDINWSWESPLQRGGAVYVDGRILALGEDGHLAAVEAGATGPNVIAITAEPVIEGPCYSAPVVAQGRLFVRTEREVVCFRLADDAKAGDLSSSLDDVDTLSGNETVDPGNDN